MISETPTSTISVLHQPKRGFSRMFMMLGVACAAIGTPVLHGDPAKEEIRQLHLELEALKERLERLEGTTETAEEPVPQVDADTPPAPSREIEPDLPDDLPDSLEDRQQARVLTPDPEPEEEALQFTGALRFNASIRDYDSGSKKRVGDSGFELFRIGVRGQLDGFLISAQYRFYPYMNTLHHGWIGYDFASLGKVKVGVSQVPFGLLPYAAHNYWFGVPYYAGLADNHDLGIQYLQSNDAWDLRLAFYKNEELGDSTSLNRYAFDVVRIGDQQNEKVNQLNARLARTFDSGSLATHEAGVSGQFGGLFNRTTERTGHHWAAAAHLDTRIERWNFQVQLAGYEHNPKNPPGISNDTVTLGALGTSYEIASGGWIAVGNVAYTVPVPWSPVDQLIVYNNYSHLFKKSGGFRDSRINTVGAAVGMGPLFMYVDWIQAKNMPFFRDGSLAGGGESSWMNRFNINLGYYW